MNFKGPKAYLAGNISNVEPYRAFDWRTVVEKRYNRRLQIINPCRIYVPIVSKYNGRIEPNKHESIDYEYLKYVSKIVGEYKSIDSIAAFEFNLIEKVDCIIANLYSNPLSLGTIAELFYAKAHGGISFVIHTDDASLINNPFIRELTPYLSCNDMTQFMKDIEHYIQF